MMKKNIRFILALPLFILLKYRILGNKTFKKIYARVILSNCQTEYLERKAKEFTNRQEFKNDINKEVLAFISRYPDADKVVVSANYNFLVGAICSVLDINEYIGISLEKKNGRFNGKIHGLIPHGEDKIQALKKYLGETVYKQSIGLGDCSSDVPLLNYLSTGYLVKHSKKQNSTSFIQVN